MRALTVRQPWASAIVAGVKPVENRSRRLGASPGEWIAIHAAKAEHADAGACRRLWPACPPVVPMGAIVGLALVQDEMPVEELEIDAEGARWVSGAWVLLIGQALALDEPVPCRGMLGLWRVTPDLLGQMPPRIGG